MLHFYSWDFVNIFYRNELYFTVNISFDCWRKNLIGSLCFSFQTLPELWGFVFKPAEIWQDAIFNMVDAKIPQIQ